MPVTRVLHAAGNYRDLHPLALHPAVDAIEADTWVRFGELVAHHERPLGRLPLMVHPRGLRRALTDPVQFGELVLAVQGCAALVLDLRSWLGDPAPDVARVLLGLRDRSHIAVTCESWKVADRLRAWLPGQRVAYTVRSERDLRRYLTGRVSGAIPEPAPVAVRHTLLHSPGEVESLRRRAGHVAVWTVDDVDRAIELAGWGIDEIVSNRLQVLNSV